MRKKSKSDEFGAIGIGTLIVFIALILVAAIAAAVIIGTAEELEEQAETAGQDAENLVEGKINLMYAEGTIDSVSGEIDEVDLYIDLYGSQGVDMRDIVLHVIATPADGTAVSDNLEYNEASPTTASADYFGTEEISDPLDQYDPTSGEYVLGERVKLYLTVDLGLSTTSLSEDSTLQVIIHVGTSGTVTNERMRTPSAYPTGGVVLLED